MGDVTSEILKQGTLGAIIVVLAGVVGFLYREIRGRDASIAALQKQLLEMAVAHATTDTELANKIIEAISTLNELFSNTKNRRK